MADDLTLESILGPPPAAEQGFVDRFADSARYGAANILEDYAVGAEQLGLPGFAQALRSYRPQVAPGFRPATDQFLRPGQQGFGWEYLPRAVVEQGAQLGASLTARAAGAAAGGAVAGPAGAAAGAIGLPMVASVAQRVGPVAVERARQNGRDTPDQEDWLYALGTAGASGALESIGAAGLVGRAGRGAVGSGVLGRVGTEALTEGAQSAVEQAGTTVNTPGGIRVDPKLAAGEAILGGAAGAPAAVAGRVRSEGNGPTHALARDEDDAALADRIRREAEEGGYDLRQRDRSTNDGAYAAVTSVKNEITAEGRRNLEALRAYARQTGDAEGAALLRRVSAKAFGASNASAATDADLASVVQQFPDVQEAHNFASLARQRRKVNDFLRPNGTYGGISQYTRMLDPFESKSGAFQKAVGLGSLTMGAGLPGLAVNRAAAALDKLSGRYSPVERFARSGDGIPLPEPRGTPAFVLGQEAQLDAGNDFPADALPSAKSRREQASAEAAELRRDIARTKAEAAAAQEADRKASAGLRNQVLAEKARVAPQREEERSTAAALRNQTLGVRARAAGAQEADRKAAAYLRQQILKHNSEAAKARMTVAQARAAREEMRAQAQEARDLLTLARLKKAEEAEAQAAGNAADAQAREQAKAAPIPELSTAERAQVAKVYDNSRYWGGDAGQAAAAISAEYRAMLDGGAADHGYDLNAAQRKASKGVAAGRAIGELTRRVNGRSDLKFSAKKRYFDPLNAMNHPNVDVEKRREAVAKIEAALEAAADGGDAEAQLALRIAAALRDAGSEKSNDGQRWGRAAKAERALQALQRKSAK